MVACSRRRSSAEMLAELIAMRIASSSATRATTPRMPVNMSSVPDICSTRSRGEVTLATPGTWASVVRRLSGSAPGSGSMTTALANPEVPNAEAVAGSR